MEKRLDIMTNGISFISTYILGFVAAAMDVRKFGRLDSCSQ
jgi:hypothetical protein